MAEETKPVEDLIIDESLDANSLTIEKTKDDSEDEDTIDDDYEKILEVKEEFVKNKKKTALDKILIGLIVFLVLLAAGYLYLKKSNFIARFKTK